MPLSLSKRSARITFEVPDGEKTKKVSKTFTLHTNDETVITPALNAVVDLSVNKAASFLYREDSEIV